MKNMSRNFGIHQLIFLVLFTIPPFMSFSQTYQWAKRIGGVYQDGGNVIARDQLGNIYIAGRFNDTVDFDPGPGTFNLIDSTFLIYNQGSAFISKYTANGDFIWAKGLMTNTISQNDQPAYINSIAIDPIGNLIITGRFNGTVDFDPDSNLANLTSAGSTDIFIAKYNSSGAYLWANRVGGIGSDFSFTVKSDVAGNVIIGGYFNDTVDFDPGPNVINLIGTGETDIFIAKYDAGGNYIWAKGMVTSGFNYTLQACNLINIDSSTGDIYAAGFFNATVDFDPGPDTAKLTATGNTSIFIANYDSGGNYKWVKQIGGLGDGAYYDKPLALLRDASRNIYLAGSYSDTADFDPGPGTAYLINPQGPSPGLKNGFIAKYDSTGNYIWAHGFGDNDNDEITAIAFDGYGDLYLAGYFSGNVDFDPGLGTANLLAIGYSSLFLAKYDTNCSYIWAEKIGTVTGVPGISSMTADSIGNVYVTGAFSGTTDFNPIATVTDNLVSAGYGDIFMAKYGPICFPQSISNIQSICNGSFYTINGHIYTDAGIYIDTLQSLMGCDSTVTTFLAVDTVNASVSLNATTLSAVFTGDSYQWIDCNNGNSPIPGETSQSFNPATNGSYAVIITKNGCSDTSVCTTVTSLDIEQALSVGFSISPNPNGGSFVISLNGDRHKCTELLIFNSFGDVVFQTKIRSTMTNINTDLDKGIYFVRLVSSSGYSKMVRMCVL